MDPTPAPEGSPAWALEQLRAGKRVRKSGWGLGHVRLEGERLIVRDAEDRDLEVPRTFLEEDIGQMRWELDLPRRYAVAGATRLDLAMLPADIPVGLLIQALDRCVASDRNFSALVLSAWAVLGQQEIGERLLAYANSPEGYVAMLAARTGHDPKALPHVLGKLEEIRGTR